MPQYQGWFSVEGVPLRWQYPIGLLFDLFTGSSLAAQHLEPNRQIAFSRQVRKESSSQLPWHLVIHFSEWPEEQLIPLDEAGKIHQDLFVQSVKEADYLRNGTGKTVMLMSKDDSTNLWQSVREHDLARFAPIYRKFLNPQGGDSIRHVPVKVYIPQVPSPTIKQASNTGENETNSALRVAQGLIALVNPSTKTSQTFGTALHSLLPKLFPSRSLYIHACAVLHGGIVPPTILLQDLIEGAVFCDGFLHVAVAVMDFGNH